MNRSIKRKISHEFELPLFFMDRPTVDDNARFMLMYDVLSNYQPPSDQGAYLLVMRLRENKWIRLCETLSIGKHADNDLTLADPFISKNHCMLSQSSHRWLLTDLQSRNGTCVNQKRVRRRLLKDGDLIQIGNIVLFFVGEIVRPAASVGL